MIPNKGIAVDGSSLGNPGESEFRGIDLSNGKELFNIKIGHSTNNIAEFLGICYALKYAKKYKYTFIYSDSQTAISWFRNRKANTTLKLTDKTKKSIEFLKQSEEYIKDLNINYNSLVMKWDTKKYGEIPADFGRK